MKAQMILSGLVLASLGLAQEVDAVEARGSMLTNECDCYNSGTDMRWVDGQAGFKTPKDVVDSLYDNAYDGQYVQHRALTKANGRDPQGAIYIYGGNTADFACLRTFIDEKQWWAQDDKWVTKSSSTCNHGITMQLST